MKMVINPTQLPCSKSRVPYHRLLEVLGLWGTLNHRQATAEHSAAQVVEEPAADDGSEDHNDYDPFVATLVCGRLYVYGFVI